MIAEALTVGELARYARQLRRALRLGLIGLALAAAGVVRAFTLSPRPWLTAMQDVCLLGFGVAVAALIIGRCELVDIERALHRRRARMCLNLLRVNASLEQAGRRLRGFGQR